jgi:hypothetical protein
VPESALQVPHSPTQMPEEETEAGPVASRGERLEEGEPGARPAKRPARVLKSERRMFPVDERVSLAVVSGLAEYLG